MRLPESRHYLGLRRGSQLRRDVWCDCTMTRVHEHTERTAKTVCLKSQTPNNKKTLVTLPCLSETNGVIKTCDLQNKVCRSHLWRIIKYRLLILKKFYAARGLCKTRSPYYAVWTWPYLSLQQDCVLSFLLVIILLRN